MSLALSAQNHPQAVGHQREDWSTALWEREIFLRDESSTLQTPIATTETRTRQQRGGAVLAGKTSAPGRRAQPGGAAEGRPAHLSPQAARQQVVERQPLGTDLRDGGGRRHPGTRNIKFSL